MKNFENFQLFYKYLDVGDDKGFISNTTVMQLTKVMAMRTYDEMRELDIVETQESLR